MQYVIRFKNFLPILAIPAAVFLPRIGQILSPYTSWLLGLLLFLAFLGLDPKKLLNELKTPLQEFYMAMIVLVITPLVILPVMGHFFPTYLLGALIFMLMPSAVSSPAVTRIYGGNVALATANTVFNSLLSPFTIPVLIGFFAGARIELSLLTILKQVFVLMFTPFILSLIIQHFAPKSVEKAKKSFTNLSLLILFLLFFGAVSPYSAELVANLFNGRLWLAVLVAHVILFFFAKLMVIHLRKIRDRVSVQANIMFLNVGLAIVLAQTYFGPAEIIFIVYTQIFWVLMVGLFKYLK